MSRILIEARCVQPRVDRYEGREVVEVRRGNGKAVVIRTDRREFVYHHDSLVLVERRHP